MSFVTVLVVAFVLNGQPTRVELLSQSMQHCVQDTFIAQTVLNRIGALTLSISCETRTASPQPSETN